MRQLLLALILFQGTTLLSQTINFGDLISGEITANGQIDSYSFSANAGDVIYIAAKGFGVAPRVEVFEPGGNEIGEVSSGASYQSGSIVIQSSGTHTLTFEDTFGDQTGTYSVGFERIDPATNAVSKQFGDLIEGTFTSPAQVDLYTFSANAGEAIYLAVKGIDGVAPRAKVYDSNGDFVGSISSGASYESGRIYIEQSGTHTLIFEETFLENTGTYYMGLEKVALAENATPKNFGDLIQGTITTPAQVDLYTFNAAADEVIYLAVKGIDGVAPRARVYDSNGNLVGSVSTGASYQSGSLSIQNTGTHTIVFEETFLENTGTYNIALERVFPVVKAEQMTLNEIVGRPLDLVTQVDLYAFEASAGDAIYLSVGGYNGVSPRARVFDPNGDQVGSVSSGASSTTGIFNLELTGQYIISFEDTFLEDVGDYCLGIAFICNGTNCDDTASINAEFGACKTQAMPGETIDFLNLSPNVSSRSWTFEGGDPASSTSRDPSITYNSAGIYDVELNVSDGTNDDTETKLDYIVISNETPVEALFESDSSTIVQGDSIQFEDLSTGNITSWSWDFEGGTPSTSNNQNPNIIYSSVGMYNVSLTVSNGSTEDSKTMVGYVIVSEAEEPPLNANFTFDKDSISRGESVQFTDASTGNVIAWNWTFEGGTPSTSTEQSPTVVYNNEGLYYVSLIVDDGTETDELVLSDLIEVSIGPLPDLIFTGISISPNSEFAGNSVTATAALTNAGEADIDGQISVDYYLSSDDNLDGSDINLGTNFITDLAQSSAQSIEGDVVIPATLGSGDYYVIFEIDASNTIEESDETNNIESFSFEVRDRTPILTSPIADLDLEQGFTSESIDLSTVFEDPDEDQLSYTASSTDNAIVTVSISGSNLVLTEQGSGISTITITADDNEDGSVSDEFLVAINAASNNRPIVENPIDYIELFVGFSSETIELEAVFSDQDGDNLEITLDDVQGSSVEPTLDGTLLTFSEQSEGATSFTIRANDGNGGLAYESFDVIVISNVAPTIENPIADIVADEGFVNETVDIAEVFSDADGDDLTYSAVSDDETVVTVSVSSTNLIVVEQGIGEANITVTADDGNGGTASDSFTFTVNDVNETPVLENPIPDINLEPGFVSEIIELDTVFTDPDGDILTYSVTSSDEEVVQASISENNIVLTEVGVGTSTITVIADDGRGETVEDSFTVLNQGNTPPEVETPIDDHTYTQGFVTTSLSFEGVFSDVDGDELTYFVESLNEDIVTVSITGTNIVIIEHMLGTATIILTADDGREGIARDTFDVSVVENTFPEESNPLDDQTLEEGFESMTYDLSDIFIDADGDELVFSATTSDENVVMSSTVNSTLTLTEVSLGEAIITITADDNNGGTAFSEFIVEVVEGALAVDDPSNFVYPTITDGVINISTEKSIHQSQLIHVDGSQIKSFGDKKRITADGLASGVYILLIDFADGSQSRMKVIISR